MFVGIVGRKEGGKVRIGGEVEVVGVVQGVVGCLSDGCCFFSRVVSKDVAV